MAKQRDPYESVRSYNSSGSGRSSKARDPYAAIASYKTPKMSAEDEERRRKSEQRAKQEAEKKKPKSVNLADLASKVKQGANKVGAFLFSGTEKVGDAIDSLSGHTGRQLNDLDKLLGEKKISRTDYQKRLKSLQDDISWAGTKPLSTKERLKKAGGVSLEATTELAPIPIGKAVKGASKAKRIAKAASISGATTAVGSAGAQLAQDGKIDIPKTLADLAVGAGLGGAVSAASGTKAVRNAMNKVKEKIPFVSADEGGLNIKSMAEADKARKRATAASEAQTKFIDSNHPILGLTQQVENILGRKLNVDEDPYQLMKLRGGVEGQATMHLKDTADWFSGVPSDIRKDGDLYGYAKQYLGQSGKRTPEQLARAQKQVDILSQKYGGDLSILDDYTEKTRQTFDSLIDAYEGAGMISKKHADGLRKNPDYFAKMEVLQDETEKVLRNGGTVNVREASALKGVKGHSDSAALAPSAEAYVKQTIKTMQDIANNKVGRAMGDLADQLGDNELIKRLRSTSDVTTRQDKMKFLAETKPGKQAVSQLLRTRSKELRRLTSELNRLNRQGMQISLKKTPEDVEKPILSGVRDVIQGHKTIEAGHTIKIDRPIEANITGAVEGLYAGAMPGPDKAGFIRSKGSGEMATQQFSRSLTAGETRSLVQSLVLEDPAELGKIRKMIETRAPKMKALFDDVENLRDELDGFNTARSQAFQEMHKHADDELPKGYSRISYLDNGVRNEIAVPKEIGDILTGADKETFDVITRTAGKIHNIFRQAVTTYNPLFVFLRNPARDFKSFAINSRYVPVHKAVTAYVGGLLDSLTGGKYKEEFLRSGGGQAGYFAREGGQYGKQMQKEAAKITGKRSIASRVVTSPRDFMQYMSEAIESAPRIAEYKHAKKAGMSDDAAAIAGREVTVDFAQGGSLARVANQWIPFLNARAQGVRRTAQAFRENPKRALTVWGATGIVPIAAAAAWNSQFPEILADIPDYEKENNFILVLGPDNIMKIPKGDVDKILGNTLETALNQMFTEGGDVAQDLKRSLISGASNLSPISFVSNGDVSASSVLSGVLPPTLKAPTEWAANKSFFKDAPVVPENMQGAPASEQVTDKTSSIAQFLGGKLGQSPMMLDNALNNLAGNIPADIANALTLNPASAERMKKGATTVNTGKIESEFWKVYGPAKKTREYREKQIYRLIDEGKYKEAQRKADSYNSDVDGRFSGYFKDNGAYLPQTFDSGVDPYEIIDGLKIDVQVSKKGRPYIKR